MHHSNGANMDHNPIEEDRPDDYFTTRFIEYLVAHQTRALEELLLAPAEDVHYGVTVE